MADFYKHQRESKDIAVGFSDALDDGDSLSTVDNIVLTKKGGSADLSSEFGSPTGSIDGTDVDLTLGVAGADQQAEGIYFLLVEITTTGGDTLVAGDDEGRLPTIKVSDEGEPTS